eukprot:16300_1
MSSSSALFRSSVSLFSFSACCSSNFFLSAICSVSRASLCRLIAPLSFCTAGMLFKTSGRQRPRAVFVTESSIICSALDRSSRTSLALLLTPLNLATSFLNNTSSSVS